MKISKNREKVLMTIVNNIIKELCKKEYKLTELEAVITIISVQNMLKETAPEMGSIMSIYNTKEHTKQINYIG